MARTDPLHYRNGYSSCQKEHRAIAQILNFSKYMLLSVAISATVAEIATASHLTFEKKSNQY
ncbi:TPA: hypothetical protein ACJ2OB_000601 [Klebsiella pneumoniae]